MLEKRKWVYLDPPAKFGIPPCNCGNVDVKWSEYKERVWCETCQKDYIPEHWGILDGPIPINTATMLGVSFDRFNLETDTVEIFNIYKCEWETKE